MKGTRREFFGESAKIIVSGMVGGAILSRVAEGKDAPTSQASAKKDEIEQRPLGRSGLKLTVISVGTGATNVNVLRYAMDQGINFIHTSPSYSDGRSIRRVGKALKGRKDKDKIRVGLKMTWDLSDGPLDKALKTLGRKYVDVLFFPRHNPKHVDDKRLKQTFDRWKRQGKVKFMGLTSHDHIKPCMEAALRTGWYDCLMPSYNVAWQKEFGKVFRECEKKKVGVVLMKTKISPTNTAAVPVLLGGKAATTICRTLSTFREVKSYLSAAKRKVKRAEAERVIEQAELAAIGRCHMCGRCTAACSQGLAVNDLVRSVDYYVDTINHYEMGKETYDEIGSQANAANCAGCGQCEKACPHHVPVRHFVQRSRDMFT